MRAINQDKQQLPLEAAYGLQSDHRSVNKRIISGLVTSIIDGNTFVMRVQALPEAGDSEGRHEKIRIQGMNAPSISTLSGILAKLELEKRIVGRRVECEIIKREGADLLLAVLPKQYLVTSQTG